MGRGRRRGHGPRRTKNREGVTKRSKKIRAVALGREKKKGEGATR